MKLPRGTKGLSVKVATTLDEIRTAILIRSSIFIARGEPWFEEFDGNDFAACSHLILYQDRDAVATMRVRFIFGTECAWERVAVRPFSDPRSIHALINAARMYCQNKGMTRAIGAVENERFQKFLLKKGARILDEPPLEFGDAPYAVMDIPLSAAARPNGNLEIVPEWRFLEGQGVQHV
jgi:predicted GNAT family N-acyltransferase